MAEHITSHAVGDSEWLTQMPSSQTPYLHFCSSASILFCWCEVKMGGHSKMLLTFPGSTWETNRNPLHPQSESSMRERIFLCFVHC